MVKAARLDGQIRLRGARPFLVRSPDLLFHKRVSPVELNWGYSRGRGRGMDKFRCRLVHT